MTRRPAAAAVVLAAAAAGLGGWRLAATGPEAHARAVPLVSPAGIVQRSGVRVTHVAVTGDGGLVDLRYQVLDADKAASLHDQATPPLLIDERTGGVVGELLMGHFHSGRPRVGLTYYLIFLNPGGILRSGGRVTVQLGDARLPHVRVR